MAEGKGQYGRWCGFHWGEIILVTEEALQLVRRGRRTHRYERQLSAETSLTFPGPSEGACATQRSSQERGQVTRPRAPW